MTSVTRRLPLVTLACILFAIPIFLCANANAATLKVTLITEQQTVAYKDSNLTEEAGTLYFGDEVAFSSKGSTSTKVKVTNGTLDGAYVYVKSSLLNPDAAEPSFSYPRYLEISGSQKLRKTSSTSSTSYGYIARGTEMEVLGIVTNSKGTSMLKVRKVKTYTGTLNSKVKYSSKSGYTRKSYAIPTNKYVGAATTSVKVYKYADENASIAKMERSIGQYIQVLNRSADGIWMQFETKSGEPGYIKASDTKDYLETVKASSVTMRVTTSSKSKKITTFHKGNQVVILFRIKIDGSTYALTQCQKDGKTVRGWIKTQSKTTTYVA